ncbi:MAG: uracil-DNA glycosylase [Firmicutes bacterium]|nr:uracil-DNA glycosylase [Bacillota bacterium]
MTPTLPPAWQALLKDELQKPYWRSLEQRLGAAYESGALYPPAQQLFAAFERTPPARVRAVILGQDPYHEPGQANGLAFSVSRGVKLPPSLQNIYKELEADLGVPAAKSGDLTSWAQQGVFLLNTVLSVRAHAANSHKDFGWQSFTDAVIAALAELPQPVAFVLWGAQAQKKAALVEKSPYPRLVLQSPHPSPLSAYRGFFGSRPFSQINAFLVSYGFSPVDWKIPEDAQKHSPEG